MRSAATGSYERNGGRHLAARGIPETQLTSGGTLKPVYTRDIPNDRGQQEFAVGMEAFAAVAEGYACGNCLEYAAFRGAYLPTCPTCGAKTGAGGPEQLASEWWTSRPAIRP